MVRSGADLEAGEPLYGDTSGVEDGLDRLLVLRDRRLVEQIDAAVALARREDAHLDVFLLGVDHTQTGYYYAGASAYVFQESIDRAMAAAGRHDNSS